MKNDPVVVTVRKARRAISRRFGDDPRKLGNHYKKYQKRFGSRLREPIMIRLTVTATN